MKNCVKCNALKWNLSEDGVCWDCEKKDRAEARSQHAASAAQPNRYGERVLGFGEPEDLPDSEEGYSSLMSLNPFLHKGKSKPKYSRC